MARSARTRTGLGAAALLLVAAAVQTAVPTTAVAQAPELRGHSAPRAAPAPSFQQVTLAKGAAEMGEPISMTVLPDRSVLHTSRDGTVRLTDAAGNTKVAGKLTVYAHDEEGLQGIAADPNFATNRHLFLYYAPPLSTPAGDAPSDGTDFSAWNGVNRLSRFVLNADGTLNTAGEKVVLDVPASRGTCCHVGGDIDFDAAGNLYLSTGDDTNPFASDGYSPLDERANRNPAFDAQRSAGNTNDLRGKLLRIKVNADGGYSVPAGNMFAPGTAGTRAEIYAMGFRNPFRFNVDKATGVVYLGDYGPDAGSTSATRGPAGQVEFNRITGPGFYGWPYCTGSNTADETYNDHNFATGVSGAKYNCAGGPTNNSPRNTGLPALPAAKAAWIKYDNCSVAELGCGSESPMGGPVYRYDAGLNSAVKFPQSYDGHFFATEFGRRWIKDITVNANGTPGAIAAFPWTGTQVMDSAFGPDGALYVLDYGTGWFAGDANSALYRIEYATGGLAPIAKAAADKTSGQAPLAVTFSSAGSSDPDGDAITFAWKFGDGGTSTAANPQHTYSANGVYTATLTVTDATGRTATASVQVTVGNTAPTVTLHLPQNGQLFDFGDAVPFRITVTDPEDGAVDCTKVKLSYILGHDSHGHKLTEATGCSGTVQTPQDGEHDPNANIFGVWDAEYTDRAGATTHTQHVTQPKTRQAEHHGSAGGVAVFDKAAAHGGKTVGDIHNGDWIAFQPYVLADATSITARVSSAGAGGVIEVRAGSVTGALLGSATVPVTGGWDTFTDVSAALTNRPAGTTTLYLVFKGGTGALFDVDDFTFATGARTGRITGVGGKCVDVSGAATADGTKIQLYTCNGTTAQQWTAAADRSLRALGKCLDVRSGGTANGTATQLWTCNGSGAQQWAAQPDGALVNPQSGRCLDAEGGSSADGTALTIRDCTGGANQKWIGP
ncbi:PQQ-dependent sugar dehydrogenase [Saccharothrix texasensis]|uniref:Glucose/arabinose dehydrogenase n=1 Tax=Saccharothrix texasensis TaxID=103734 RepID=A0A3N1HHS5_9PSEU|nr:PQQ-dependent sugar dehydrogenase [Saccharothrix texasensis]ROP42073.1 glucose/arabinose dehydrogenase [Saccharothrix texasensis]